MAGAIKHIKVLAAALGIGTQKAANTGGAFVDMRYTDVIAGADRSGGGHHRRQRRGSGRSRQPHHRRRRRGPDSPAQPDASRPSAGQTEAITVTGTDQFDAAQTEAITFNGAATVAGTKVFKTVTQAACAPRSGAANISVGVGNIMGTSRKMNSLSIDAAVYTTASGVYAWPCRRPPARSRRRPPTSMA